MQKEKPVADYLFISNGHGEDLVAAAIIDQLFQISPLLSIAAYPLVGMGESFLETSNVSILEPRRLLPSGGFVKGSFRRLWKDYKAGLKDLFQEQIKTLKQVAPTIGKVVVVGDFLPVALAWLFVKRPIYFVATAKSDFIAPHWRVERALFRRGVEVVFTRDELTESSLTSRGIKAVYLGNVMMDCLRWGVKKIRLDAFKKTLAFIPGSRANASENLLNMLQLLSWLKSDFNYLVAWSDKVKLEDLAIIASAQGWQWQVDADQYRLKNLDDNIEVQVVKGAFADVINAADVVVGMSGTANEQAVGMGKPVIAYPLDRQMSKFLKDQKKLLGPSLFVMPNNLEKVAGLIRGLIDDESRLKRLAESGKERLGQAGGAKKIARYLESETIR